MAKPEIFYTRFLEALFNRKRTGDADVAALPLSFLESEGAKVMYPAEMEKFRAAMEAGVAQGSYAWREDVDGRGKGLARVRKS